MTPSVINEKMLEMAGRKKLYLVDPVHWAFDLLLYHVQSFLSEDCIFYSISETIYQKFISCQCPLPKHRIFVVKLSSR